MPLNYDLYTRFTLTFPNSALLANSKGRLDAKGRATATLQVPKGLSPSLIGLSVHHAYLTFAGTAIRTASNPVPVFFVR